MPLSNAEKQRRWRDRRADGVPVVRHVTTDRKRRELRELQESYQAWREILPESLEASATAQRLDAVIDLDLAELEEIELPRGFGRDGFGRD